MSGSPHSLVVFSVDERQFALDIAAVKSVHRSVEISTRPESPPGVREVITVRGAHAGTDAGLAELPVILASSLRSREYQERGIEAGAHAYIVKSNFDQSYRLEVIRKLL